MKEEIIEIIRHRMKRAKDSLADAGSLLSRDSFHSTVNRIDYATFYCASALLLTRNLSSSKHSGVMSLFQKEFVVSGIVRKDMGRFYSNMFKKRQEGDYKDFADFEREDVEEWFEKAKEFMAEIENVILKTIEKDDIEK